MKDVTETITEFIENITNENVITNDRLEDLGLDSLDIAGIVGFCEHEFNIEIIKYNNLVHVSDVISLVKTNMRK